NGLGDRLEQTVNGTPIDYTLDINTGLTQVLSDGTNVYLYGVNRIAQVGDPDTAYFLGDALGSVRQLVDGGGQVSLAEHYAPFGAVTSSSGFGNSIFGFARQQTDSTGLVFLRARYYSPLLNQWIQPDSLVPDPYKPLNWNLYLYTWDNPVNYVDPSGLRALLVLACGVGTNGACESGTPLPDYDNKVPLSPFANWGHQNGYDVKYYDYDLHASKGTLAHEIERYIVQHQEDTNVILVGHSAGADSVVYAASLYVVDPKKHDQIRGVMVLDMDLDTHYSQDDIDKIQVAHGVPVRAFHSLGYGNQPAGSQLVWPPIRELLGGLICYGVHLPGHLHLYLAVDQSGFDKYMKPALDAWSR
ncbi:MAG: RHS repeat-associated core domain-containing protein, partial [Anaerolineales bacterium]